MNKKSQMVILNNLTELETSQRKAYYIDAAGKLVFRREDGETMEIGHSIYAEIHTRINRLLMAKQQNAA